MDMSFEPQVADQEDMGLPAELLGPLPDISSSLPPALAASHEVKPDDIPASPVVMEASTAAGAQESSEEEEEEVEVMGGEECEASFQDDIAGTELGDQGESFNEQY